MVRVEVRAHGLDEVSEEEHGGLAVDGERGDGGVAERGEEGVPGRAGDGGRLRDDVGGVRERAELGEGIGRGERGEHAVARGGAGRLVERAPVFARRGAQEHRGEVALGRGGGDDALQERANDRGIVRSRRHVTLSLGARGRVHARGGGENRERASERFAHARGGRRERVWCGRGAREGESRRRAFRRHGAGSSPSSRSLIGAQRAFRAAVVPEKKGNER